jgi:hypothetical protein
VTGGEVNGDFTNGSLMFDTTSGITVQGTKICEATKPVVASGCSGMVLKPQIKNVTETTTAFALALTNVDRSIIAPTILAPTSGFFGGGVSLDSACSFNSVEGTAMNPGSFVSPSNATLKVVFNAQDASTGAGKTAFELVGNVMVGSIG